jgi:protein gp37
MQRSAIEWTDFTWNAVTGCSKISQGCKNCYAATMTKRFEKQWGPFNKIQEHAERLADPAKRKKGVKIFVCSMSDLFHEEVTYVFIDQIYAVMRESPQHTFQVLTKRPKRMAEYYNRFGGMTGGPMKNLWVGVSAENQGRADERIPVLLEVPAAVRFVSVEPQLNYIDLTRYLDKLDWVIVGGETGRYARPFDLNWARDLREQCRAAGVPFFFKQTGGRPNLKTLDGMIYNEFPKEAA